jgi:Icc-related predicted phosphoesterase
METGNNLLKILTVSDEVVERFYNVRVRDLLPDIELIISCGDLPYYYLEFMLDVLGVPMFFVHGNHDPTEEITERGTRTYPWGAINIHQKFIWHKGLIFFGLEGSVRYSKSRHQYTQLDMWLKVLRAVPRFLYNRVRHGRALDVFVTHSPAWQLGDAEDPAHQGFKAFRWLLEVFRPRYHIHGHVHIYDRNDLVPYEFLDTTIVNTCTYQRLEIDLLEVRNG